MKNRGRRDHISPEVWEDTRGTVLVPRFSNRVQWNDCSVFQVSIYWSINYNVWIRKPARLQYTNLVCFFEYLEDQMNEEVIGEEQFPNMICCLQFLAHQSIPDIATVVRMLSQFSTKPTSFPMKSLKRLFVYLCGAQNYGLRFNLTSWSKDILTLYSDYDFVGKRISHKSRSGWLGKFFLDIYS